MADLRGTQGTCPRGPNSFNFMQFLEKFGKIICWRPPGELAPPPRGNPGSATDIIQHKLNTNINLFKTWWEIMIAENLTVNQKQSLNMYVDPDKFNRVFLCESYSVRSENFV